MGWNPFRSKTVYYVSSSTFPAFDRLNRINSLAAGMLDYTSNSQYEQSEYFRKYVKDSTLYNLWRLQNWADSSGYSAALGKPSATFYGNAEIDNTKVSKALKSIIPLAQNQTIAAYQTNLGFFSEDFYIKHLAFAQGKEGLVYQDTDADYTLSYPSPNRIKATFKNGKAVAGDLPVYQANTRFLAICFTITTKTVTETSDPDDPTKDPVKVTTYGYRYGYYYYQEGTGNSQLDALIKNNGIHSERSFYPAIPLRSDTAWFTGTKADHINSILKMVGMYDPMKGMATAYKDLQKQCEDGMSSGSISDVDYITLLLGVSINSHNQADQKYIFNFFFSLYTNAALAAGKAPQSFTGGLPTDKGAGNFSNFYESSGPKVAEEVYQEFKITNPASNLNLSFGWVNSEYFENNGVFKPGAKPGEYGTLAGKYTYTRYYQVPSYDEETGLRYDPDNEGSILYEWVPETFEFNLTFFCYQSSANRWKSLAFADLKLVNLVYAGKTICTSAYDAVKDSTEYSELQHDFSKDVSGAKPEWSLLKFAYVENPGNSASAFIVPLEKNTLLAIGARSGMDVSRGCCYLLFNCWVAKKKRWYSNKYFIMFVSSLGMAVFSWAPIIMTGCVLAFVTSVIMIILDLIEKILTIVFGARIAKQIVSAIVTALKVIISTIATYARFIPVFGWIIWGICMAVYFCLDVADILRNGGTLSYALKHAAITTTAAAIGSVAAGGVLSAASSSMTTAASAAGGSVVGQFSAVASAGTSAGMGANMGAIGVNSFIGGTGEALASNGSLGDALVAGLKQGAISAALYGASQVTGSFNSSGELPVGAKDVGINSLGVEDNVNMSASGATESFGRLEGEDTLLSDLEADPSYGMPTLKDIPGMIGNEMISEFKNPMNYLNVAKMGIAEVQYHKMANLESDFEEFNNKYAAATKVLTSLMESNTSTVTAESVARMQAAMGRLASLFPESAGNMSPSSFLSFSIMAGSDVCKLTLGSIDTWVDNQLSMDCYTPAELHYSSYCYNLTWDIL